jgi:hypothetical protein
MLVGDNLMRKGSILLGVGVLTIVALCLYLYISGIHVLRYRLTIKAECSGHEISGASVIDTRWDNVIERIVPLLANTSTGARITVETRGEATVLTTCSGGALVALLIADPHRHFSADAPNFVGNLVYGRKDNFDNSPLDPSSLRPNAVNVPLDRLPLLAWLSKADDVSSLVLVNPNDPPRSFNENLMSLSARLQLVSPGVWPFYLFGFTSGVPITSGINQTFPWLRTLGTKKIKACFGLASNDCIFLGADDFERNQGYGRANKR